MVDCDLNFPPYDGPWFLPVSGDVCRSGPLNVSQCQVRKVIARDHIRNVSLT